MGHNNVVSGHPKFTEIPQVNGLSTGPSDLESHKGKINPALKMSNIANYNGK